MGDGNMVYYVLYQVYALPCTLTNAPLIVPHLGDEVLITKCQGGV